MGASLRFLTMVDQTPEEMAMATWAAELLPIECGSQERCNSPSTGPQAKMLCHVAPKQAQEQDGDQNGWYVENNDIPIQAIAALQIAPAARILGGVSKLVSQHGHSSEQKMPGCGHAAMLQ
jgi:hypothetical protein